MLDFDPAVAGNAILSWCFPSQADLVQSSTYTGEAGKNWVKGNVISNPC